MKKVVIVLSFLLIFVVGCNVKKFDNALNKMNNLDSYNMVTTTEIKSEDFDITIEDNLDFQKNNGMLTTKNSFNDEETKYIKDNKIYELHDGTWYYKEDDTLALNIFTNVEAERIESDNSETKYKLTFSEDIINKITSGINATTNYELVESYAYVNDDNYISKVIISIPVVIIENNKDVNMDILVTINFSKYNEVIVNVLEELNSADDMKVLMLIEDLEKYIFELEVKLWDTELSNSTYTDSSFELDGIKPTNVNLNFVNGLVKDGTIELDGYLFNISNSYVTNYEKIN